MLGAIAGDIIGSVYEWNNIKTKGFVLFNEGSKFTDDTVLTVALADSILNKVSYKEKLVEYYELYPQAGYGGDFYLWAISTNHEPYNSWGNGSAMRVSPIGWAYNSLDDVLKKAAQSAEYTHNHPEGIKGAQAVASSIYLARTGRSKKEIKEFLEKTFHYNFDENLDEIRLYYSFDVSCQGSVPKAIIAFLESTDFCDAIRNAVSIGGDSDTIACITGSIAEAFYHGIPDYIEEEVISRLDKRLTDISRKFREKFQINKDPSKKKAIFR